MLEDELGEDRLHVDDHATEAELVQLHEEGGEEGSEEELSEESAQHMEYSLHVLFLGLDERRSLLTEAIHTQGLTIAPSPPLSK